MTPNDWRQIESIFYAALEREPADRAAFLDEACCRDETLRRQVELLLEQESREDDLLDRPAAALLTRSSDPPELRVGTQLGPYRIEGFLGAGGMGRVYRAHDSRLGRAVAIKFSMEEFGKRFRQEARVVAALNHPNICSLYDVGPDYLVMELVEGPTLRDRIQTGPLPLDAALKIAGQIAEALDAAHQRGIVHRDLKPANIKIRPDGTVKVIDFGLARVTATEGAPASSSLTAQPAMAMGTPAYVAPERARGEKGDKRADIWAFGAVLYEMLTGVQLFQGGTISDTLAAVLKDEPDLSPVPEQVRALLARCLIKDPNLRLRDIGDAMALIRREPTVPVARRSWIPWVGLALVSIALAAALARFYGKPPAGETIRFQILLPADLTSDGAPMISPDGRQLAFSAIGADRVSRIWLQDLHSLEPRLLPGTSHELRSPIFWSSDSRSLVFDSGHALKRIAVSGGPPLLLCNFSGITVGGSWNRDGAILFGTAPGGVMRVSGDGGQVSPVTEPATPKSFHIFPEWLPDRRHFLYMRAREGGTYVGSVDVAPVAQSREMLTARAAAKYTPNPLGSPPGHILFVSQGALMAQPFDDAKLRLVGDLTTVAEGVASYLAGGHFSVSNNGVLAYAPAAVQNSELTWFDRKGTAVGHLGETARYNGLALSPDGTRAVLSRLTENSLVWDLWMLEFAGNTATRLTFKPFGKPVGPTWSPDGKLVAFGSITDAAQGLFLKSANGVGNEQLLTERADLMIPSSWSPDGRYLLFSAAAPKTGDDIWAVSLDGDHQARPLVNTHFNESAAQFSPDGHWIAYRSNESGRTEIYVQRFPEAGEKMMVSTAGGDEPLWRGKELFYVAPDGKVMAVEIATAPAFHRGTPKALFRAPGGFGVWDATRDGQRFLFAVPSENKGRSSFTVVLNWQASLKK
jgi:serine/threonine protein kinase